MLSFSVILMLGCSATVFQAPKDLIAFNEFDVKHVKIAMKRCGEIYKGSPCIKKFIKRTQRDYSVICGAKHLDPMKLTKE